MIYKSVIVRVTLRTQPAVLFESEYPLLQRLGELQHSLQPIASTCNLVCENCLSLSVGKYDTFTGSWEFPVSDLHELEVASLAVLFAEVSDAILAEPDVISYEVLRFSANV